MIHHRYVRHAVVVAVAAAVFTGTAPAFAHHSFAAEFDENQPIKLTGKVTEMKWSNPHAWIYIDVVGGDGKVTNWGFETGGVNALYRRGWRKGDLPAGTVVVIDGWRARNGTTTANALSITFPDGHRLFAGTSAPNATEK
ncbi:MAG TPA: DUF6152 family protein [Vicinamibacterales bacterium]|nr:DUF6152 family protein [Vicinamibacterales bacterium]